MKRSWWVAGLTSCLSLAVSNAYAHDVQLNFQGKVTQSTCVVSSTSDVSLNSVSTNAFKGAGDVAGMKLFSINVTGCDATKIRGKFNAPISDLDFSSGSLLNTESGGSTVKIQVLNKEYKAINLASAQLEDPMQPDSADGKGAIFNFYAQYLAGAESVTAGNVKAKLMFDLVYE